jgi:hypothetical protein
MTLTSTVIVSPCQIISQDRRQRVYANQYDQHVDEDEWLNQDPPRLGEVAIGHLVSVHDDGVSTFLSVQISGYNSEGTTGFHFIVAPDDALSVAQLLLQAVQDSRNALTE